MNAYGQLCQADGTSTNEKSSDITLGCVEASNHPGRPCLSYPVQFLIDSNGHKYPVGSRWRSLGGVRLSSLGTRCIRKVRTVIIYRGFQIGDR